MVEINFGFVFEIACKTYLKLPINRVLGGESAKPREFPWMVFHLIYLYKKCLSFGFKPIFLCNPKAALGYLNENYKVSFDCAGVVISEIFIMTAAHCGRPTRPPIVVRLGKVSMESLLKHQVEPVFFLFQIGNSD